VSIPRETIASLNLALSIEKNNSNERVQSSISNKEVKEKQMSHENSEKSN